MECGQVFKENNWVKTMTYIRTYIHTFGVLLMCFLHVWARQDTSCSKTNAAGLVAIGSVKVHTLCLLAVNLHNIPHFIHVWGNARQHSGWVLLQWNSGSRWKQVGTGHSHKPPSEDQAACKQMPAPAYEAKLESLSLKQRTGHNPNLGPMAYDYQSFVLHKFHLGGLCGPQIQPPRDDILYIIYYRYIYI